MNISPDLAVRVLSKRKLRLLKAHEIAVRSFFNIKPPRTGFDYVFSERGLDLDKTADLYARTLSSCLSRAIEYLESDCDDHYSYASVELSALIGADGSARDQDLLGFMPEVQYVKAVLHGLSRMYGSRRILVGLLDRHHTTSPPGYVGIVTTNFDALTKIDIDAMMSGTSNTTGKVNTSYVMNCVFQASELKKVISESMDQEQDKDNPTVFRSLSRDAYDRAQRVAAQIMSVEHCLQQGGSFVDVGKNMVLEFQVSRNASVVVGHNDPVLSLSSLSAFMSLLSYCTGEHDKIPACSEDRRPDRPLLYAVDHYDRASLVGSQADSDSAMLMVHCLDEGTTDLLKRSEPLQTSIPAIMWAALSRYDGMSDPGENNISVTSLSSTHQSSQTYLTNDQLIRTALIYADDYGITTKDVGFESTADLMFQGTAPEQSEAKTTRATTFVSPGAVVHGAAIMKTLTAHHAGRDESPPIPLGTRSLTQISDASSFSQYIDRLNNIEGHGGPQGPGPVLYSFKSTIWGSSTLQTSFISEAFNGSRSVVKMAIGDFALKAASLINLSTLPHVVRKCPIFMDLLRDQLISSGEPPRKGSSNPYSYATEPNISSFVLSE